MNKVQILAVVLPDSVSRDGRRLPALLYGQAFAAAVPAAVSSSALCLRRPCRHRLDWTVGDEQFVPC